MTLSRIHINRHNIASNKKNKTKKPVISVWSKGKTRRGKEVHILSSSGKIVAKVVYSPDKPLKCGATVWIETKEKVILE